MGDQNPGGRVARGDAVFNAVKTLSAKAKALVKGELAAFTAEHSAFLKRQSAVKAAKSAVLAAEKNAGDKDAAQDRAVDALASALAGDGFDRSNPFAELGGEAPSHVKILGYADEAKAVRALTGDVTKHPRAGAASKRGAAAAVKAANAVDAALKPIAALVKARADRIAERDALGLPWEAAYAALRDAAKSGAHKDAADLSKKKKKKRARRRA